MKKLINILNQFLFKVILVYLVFTIVIKAQKSLTTFSINNFKNTELISKTITLKVLLVEFKDVKHRNPNYPVNLSLPAYTYDDFNNLLFSENKYVSPNMYSPDGKKVFGSMKDYYRIMSNDNLCIEGCILNNDTNKDNIPDWIELDSTKNYYDNCRGEEFRKEAKAKAKEAALNISTNNETFLAIIYAGHTYRSQCNTLNPEAFFSFHEYIMGERFACGSPYREERDDSTKNPISHFAHIGIHAHEFCHLLGCSDLNGNSSNYTCGLMSNGNYNGPNNEGACPAPINPYFRWMQGWVNINIVYNSQTRNLSYNINNPEVYALQNTVYPYDMFLIEYRKFDERMLMGEISSYDYNSFLKNSEIKHGILVWRVTNVCCVKLICAIGTESEFIDNHIFPGPKNIKVFTPWSDNMEYDSNCYWIPNTKPGSNCGFEIITFNDSICEIDLYQIYPVRTTPSRPKNLINKSTYDYVKLVWEKNQEPDFLHYKIYKKTKETSYMLLDSTRFSFFSDNNEKPTSNNDTSYYVYYKITTYDKENKESTFSDEIKIFVEKKCISDIKNENERLNNFILFQNYPNPFNPTTTIEYTIYNVIKSSVVNDFAFNIKVELKVFDILGREIETLVNGNQNPGNYKVIWNAKDLPSGIYFYRLKLNENVKTKEMLLMK